MTSCLSRGFRAQLTATMDITIKRAVFEIMNIFENTIHDYQRELLHEKEEVAQLKMKLQKAELNLKDCKTRRNKNQEVTATRCKTTAQPEATDPISRQTSVAPEVGAAVTATEQSDGACPSVRLRPLSIRLWHIPVLKHEVVNCDIDSCFKTENRRKDRRRDQEIGVHKRNAESQITRDDLKTFLGNIKQETIDPGYCESLRRSVRNETVPFKYREVGSRKKRRRTEEQETAENKYPCKICSKVFNSEFGQSVHARSHRKCSGCNKVFNSRCELRSHKLSCQKLGRKLAKKATKQSRCDEGKITAPSKMQGGNVISSSSRKSKNSFCPHCHKKYSSPYWLAQHMHVHTGKELHSCSLCPKRFYFKSGMKTHMNTVHKHKVYLSALNGDLEWTKPLDEIEDWKEDLISTAANSNGKGKNSEN